MNPRSSKKVYKCNKCEYSSPTKHNYENHYKRIHLGQKIYAYKCHACNKGFQTKAVMEHHKTLKSHYMNVFDHYPYCLQIETYESGILKYKPKIDNTKEHKYIEKMTSTKPKDEVIPELCSKSNLI